MFYVDEGTGDPTFVFVHGFSCCHEDWDLQRAYFRRTARVVTCDLRGHGRSAASGDTWTIDACASDVAGLLEELNIDDAVLVGHSMGSRVVLRCYLDVPHRVRALVFIDGSYVGGDGDPDSFESAPHDDVTETAWDHFIRRTFDQMFVDSSSKRCERERRLVEDYSRSSASGTRATWRLHSLTCGCQSSPSRARWLTASESAGLCARASVRRGSTSWVATFPPQRSRLSLRSVTSPCSKLLTW